MTICIQFDEELMSNYDAVGLIYSYLIGGNKCDPDCGIEHSYPSHNCFVKITKETSILVEESYTIEEIK